MTTNLLKLGFLSLLLAFSSTSNAASGVKLKSGDLNAVETARAKSLISSALARFPDKIHKKLLEHPVSVEFRSFGSHKYWGAYDRFFDNILLNKELLSSHKRLTEIRNELKADNREIRHSSLENFRLATIIHEITHHYDLSHYKTTPKIRRGHQEREGRPVVSPISDEAWFKNAIGLPSYGVVFNTRAVPTKVRRRSQDPYEWDSSAESLAVNMEFFLLDESYKCNRPFLYGVLSSMTEHEPFPFVNCEQSNKVFVLNNALLGKSPLVTINPEQVYGLHYFFAGEGDAAMSRFGHAMLRLIICKPGRKRGPECLKDLNHHLVLSYAALIEDDQISALKGLKGDYFSVLNVVPLTHAIQKYTEGELREVYSYPIKMSEEKIPELLSLLQERHWNYAGEYKFLSNNCADETLGFLKALFYEHKEIARKNVSRPDALRDLLDNNGFINTNLLTDKEYAKAQGFYFPSKAQFYQKALDDLYDSGMLLAPIKVKDYFETDLRERAPLINQVLKTEDPQKIAYAMALERAIYKNNQNMIIEKAKKSALNKTEKRQKTESSFSYLVPPVLMLPAAKADDYGVPSRGEIEDLELKIMSLIENQSSAHDEDLLNQSTEELVQQTKFLKEMLKKLIHLRRQ